MYYRDLLIELSTYFINLPLDEIDEKIQEALERIATFVDVDRAYVFRFDVSTHTARSTYEWSALGIEPHREALQNLALHIAADMLKPHSKGEFCLVEDVSFMTQGETRDLLVMQQVRSLLTFPLMQHKQCIGFVGFDAVKQKHTFTDTEIELLKFFSALLANVTDKKDTETMLLNERKFLKTLIQTIPDLVWMKDTNGVYVTCNKRFEEFFGAVESDILGKTDHDFIEDSLADSFRMHDNKAMLSGQKNINEEEVVFASDGHKEQLQTTKVPVYDNNNQLIGVLGIARDITDHKEHEQRLAYIAHFDALTGLPNRTLLSDRLTQAMQHTRRNQLSLAVIYLDLDGFKTINDTYGHESGDRLLSIVADRMKQSLREGDTIARLGGDEFVAVLPDLKTHGDCVPFLHRLLKSASDVVSVQGVSMHVSASIGVAFFDADDEADADQLLRYADQAMYQAKLTGRNRFHLFDAAHDASIKTHYETLKNIESALDHNQFVLFYQPKVNMRTGKPLGFEALIRWQHPTRGVLPPSEFLPAVEGKPLSIKIGEWVLSSVFRQIDQWKLQGIATLVSINIDAIHLLHPNFISSIQTLLTTYPSVQTTDFVLEILETTALDNIAEVICVMETCQKLDIAFSIDDFGTGYSSLTFLKRLPASELKIDKSFVQNMLHDPEDLAILDGVIGLARAFRRHIIAEGVEEIKQGEFLIRMGCDVGQGYVVSRPMPSDQVVAWLNNYRPPAAWMNLEPMRRDDLPLLYATVEHSAWVEKTLLYVRQASAKLPEQDHHECHFGHWLTSYGIKNYADHPAYHTLNQLHHDIHRIGNQLIQTAKSSDDLEAKIHEFEQHHQRILALLESFY